jgi:hypothetical protein
MRIDPTTSQIGDDVVTTFSMVHNPSFARLEPAVGGIVVEFARLEYLVKVGIERLSRNLLESEQAVDDEINFTEGMEYAENLRTFERQCEHLCNLLAKAAETPEKAEAFGALASELKQIGRERNAIVHSAWSKTDDEHVWLMLRSRVEQKKLIQYAQRVSLDEIGKLRRRINHRWFLLVASLGGEVGHVVPLKGDFVTVEES